MSEIFARFYRVFQRRAVRYCQRVSVSILKLVYAKTERAGHPRHERESEAAWRIGIFMRDCEGGRIKVGDSSAP